MGSKREVEPASSAQAVEWECRDRVTASSKAKPRTHAMSGSRKSDKAKRSRWYLVKGSITQVIPTPRLCLVHTRHGHHDQVEGNSILIVVSTAFIIHTTMMKAPCFLLIRLLLPEHPQSKWIFETTHRWHWTARELLWPHKSLLFLLMNINLHNRKHMYLEKKAGNSRLHIMCTCHKSSEHKLASHGEVR
jgi:hypothetical protein